MQLSTKSLARFVGGQLEIQNGLEGYILRGDIESIDVAEGSLKVKFVWLAKGKDGFPPMGWVKSDNLDYAVSAELAAVSDIGSGRVAVQIPATGELAVFFPPGGSRLDPARVEGLVSAA